MNTRKAIGQKIYEARKFKGLSQKELAEITGLTQSNISRIEEGKYSVGLDILCKIADALDLKVDLV